MLRKKPIYILLCFLLVCFTGLGYLGGIAQREYQMAELSAHEQDTSIISFLTQLESCMITAQNNMLHFHISKNYREAVDAAVTASKCREVLATIGPQVEDEEVSLDLGEVALFFDGYLEALKGYLLSDASLTKLKSVDPSKLNEEEQKLTEVLEESLKAQKEKLLGESQLFMKRMQQLIIKVRIRIMTGIPQDDNSLGA